MDEQEKPVIIDPPKAIWLVYGDLMRDERHCDLLEHDDIAWCEDPQFDSDVPYIRAREEDIIAWMYFCELPWRIGVVIEKEDIHAELKDKVTWKPLYG